MYINVSPTTFLIVFLYWVCILISFIYLSVDKENNYGFDAGSSEKSAVLTNYRKIRINITVTSIKLMLFRYTF